MQLFVSLSLSPFSPRTHTHTGQWFTHIVYIRPSSFRRRRRKKFFVCIEPSQEEEEKEEGRKFLFFFFFCSPFWGLLYCCCTTFFSWVLFIYIFSFFFFFSLNRRIDHPSLLSSSFLFGIPWLDSLISFFFLLRLLSPIVCLSVCAPFPQRTTTVVRCCCCCSAAEFLSWTDEERAKKLFGHRRFFHGLLPF